MLWVETMLKGIPLYVFYHVVYKRFKVVYNYVMFQYKGKNNIFVNILIILQVDKS